MLIGIDPLLSADLLHALAAMGHGQIITIVDANYPATRGRRLISLPGISSPRVLRAVLSVMPLDTFVADPAMVMQVVGDPQAVPPVVAEMNAILGEFGGALPSVMERHGFYAMAEQGYAIVQSGERRFYGCIMLVKGVLPPEQTA
jgi:L-fucose mutarotase